MSCYACDQPLSGLIRAGCRRCALRDIANGPHFFASLQTGSLTPAYRQQLRLLGDEAAVHQEVKAIAKREVYTGARG